MSYEAWCREVENGTMADWDEDRNEYARDLHGLDRWIESEPPDPGTGDSIDHPMVMTCAGCAWRVSSTNAGQVLTAAIAHVRATGHDVRYKGTVQDLSRFLPTAVATKSA